MREIIKKCISPEELLPDYINLLKEGATLPITVSGGSMLPFLAPGRDTVFIKAIDSPLKAGDIVFYRRENGRYILHRLYRLDGDKLWFVGDAQDEIEGPLNASCAFGRVSSALRKGKTEKPGTFWWDFFSKVWPKMVGHRNSIMKAYSSIRNHF